MAIDQSMQHAVSGQPASSAEYNKVVDNIFDLGNRMFYVEQDTATAKSKNTSQDSSISTLNSRTTDATSGNTALNSRLGTGVGTGTNTTSGTATAQLSSLRSRVGTLESSGGGGGGVTLGGYLALDPNNTGFTPGTAGAYEVYNCGQGTYIEFPNPGGSVVVYGCITCHLFANYNTRGGVMVEISLNGGASYVQPAVSPLARSGVVDTVVVSAQFALPGTPTGNIRVRARGMRENLSAGNTFALYRPTMYAQVLGGSNFSTG